MVFWNGFSGYPKSSPYTTDLNAVINESIARNLNAYRISFNAPWFAGTRPYHAEYIAYLYNNSDMDIIVDRNHQLDTVPTEAQWEDSYDALLAVCALYPNDPRVAVEDINEYNGADQYVRAQEALDRIRDAGYTNAFVHCRQGSPQTVELIDPLNNTYQGIHHYFNETKNPYTAIDYIRNTLGITKIINTEIGAATTVANYCDLSRTPGNLTITGVAATNGWLLGSYGLASGVVGNMIWQDNGLHTMPYYTACGGLTVDWATSAATTTSTSTSTSTSTTSTSTSTTSTSTSTSTTTVPPCDRMVCLVVDGFDSAFTDWDEIGITPYINTYGYNNYIKTDADAGQEGDFSFQNTVILNMPTTVEIQIWVKSEVDGNDVVEVWCWESAGGWEKMGEIDPTAVLAKYTIDGSSKLTTISKINEAKIRLIFKKVA